MLATSYVNLRLSPPASKFRQQFFFTLVRHPCHPHLVANKSSTKLMPHICILHQGSVWIGRLVKQLKLWDRLWFWEGVGHAVSAVGSWAGTWFEHRFGWYSWNAWIKDSFTRRLCLFAIACSHVSMKLSIVFWSYASFVFGGVQAGFVYLWLLGEEKSSGIC